MEEVSLMELATGKNKPGHIKNTPGHMKNTPGHMKNTPGHMKNKQRWRRYP